MKHEPAVRTHSPDDPPATVIHDYTADETLLARWLRRAVAKGPSFWFLAGGSTIVVITLCYLISGLFAGSTETASSWRQLILAQGPEDFERIADSEAETPAGRWASLRVATSRYQDALRRLPGDREAARPLLSQALEGFEALEKDTKLDPMIRRLAAVGVARTHETRDELPEAIAAYEKVAQAWPDTEEGKGSAKRAEALKRPEAVAFYKKFSTYTPPRPGSTTLPPRGMNRIDLPAGHPPLDGLTIPAPPIGGVRAGSVDTKGELPRDVFQKSRPVDAPDDPLPSVFPKEDDKAKTKPAPVDAPTVPPATPK